MKQSRTRSFDLVDFKVLESEYFLKKMSHSYGNLFEIRYLFSAFTSASRSITFCMQSVLKNIDGFESWYEIKRDELRKLEYSQFFIEARNLSQMVGVIPITNDSMNFQYEAGPKFKYFLHKTT